jgi:hypothetical protein
MTKVFDPSLIALNAIENASTVSVAREDLPRLLSTGEGEGSHLRALFGDVDLHTLLRLATLFDIDDPTLVRAYARATPQPPLTPSWPNMRQHMVSEWEHFVSNKGPSVAAVSRPRSPRDRLSPSRAAISQPPRSGDRGYRGAALP